MRWKGEMKKREEGGKQGGNIEKRGGGKLDAPWDGKACVRKQIFTRGALCVCATLMRPTTPRLHHSSRIKL